MEYNPTTIKEYLSETLHRTGEQDLDMDREKVADVYDWVTQLPRSDQKQIMRNPTEYLESVKENYDRLEEQSTAFDETSSEEAYSTGIAWDAAGEAYMEVIESE